MAKCRARQYNDQMACHHCGLAWDVNDPDPPACRDSTSTGPRGGRQTKRQQYRDRALRNLDAILAELQVDDGTAN